MTTESSSKKPSTGYDFRNNAGKIDSPDGVPEEHDEYISDTTLSYPSFPPTPALQPESTTLSAVQIVGPGLNQKEDTKIWAVDDQLIAKAVTDNTLLLEKLSKYLDRESRVMKCWKHLAFVLNVPAKEIRKFDMYTEHSPTEDMFNYLTDIWNPDLKVRELKMKLKTIYRMDVIDTLVKEGYHDDMIVADLIYGMPKFIAMLSSMLDKDSRSKIGNWKPLATQFGIRKRMTEQFGLRGLGPTAALFEHMSTAAGLKDLTMSELREHFVAMERKDLINILRKHNCEDSRLVRTVVIEGSELLTEIGELLNKEMRGVKNWRNLAYRLKIPHEEYDSFDTSKGAVKSPTKMLFEWLKRWKINLTVKDLLVGLKQINRFDVVDLVRQEVATEKTLLESTSKNERLREKVPLDIQARGPLATKIYNRELKNGYGYARRVPIMIIGQARTGKTSLKRSLKGELFNPNEGSTDGIEADPSYFKVTTHVWRTASNSEDIETKAEFLLDHQVAQNMAKRVKEEERLRDPSAGGTKPSETNSPPTEHSEESSSNRFEPSLQDSIVENAKAPSSRIEPEDRKTSPSFTAQSESDPQKVPENVATLVEELLKDNKKFMEGDDMYSVIWDFGGQSVFYDTHPIFLTEKAIYILTCDLSCDPYSKADTPVKQDRYCQEIRDEFCEKTNFQYLDFWMSSIHSLVSNSTNRQETSSSETLPAVFLACTHADEPYTKEGNPSLKIFRDLRKIYGSLLKDVFLVDNTKSGSNDECEGVKELREKVRSVAAKLPQMVEKIPLKWLRYEKVLYLMRKEGREKISIEDARKIASDKCGIDGEENFRTALNFLHDQKLLINFDESPGLERMVILNPQWLVDVFKEVITFKGFNHDDENVEGLWCEFEESGILKRELLDHVWKRFIDDQNTCESLIEMMEKFSLFCPWPSEGTTERYLVPSMLKSKPTSKFPNPGVETPSLFVKFKSRRVPPGVVPQGREPPGRVPPGLFSRLLLLFHRCVQDQVKINHKKRNQPKPCSNYAMFRIVPEDDISAALLCYSSLIEIVFVLEGEFLDERRLNISHGIHQQLGLILEGMRKEFSWLRHMDYELCVACSVCCGEKSSSSCGPHENRGCDCLHLFSEEELKDPFCDRKDDGASCRVAKEKFHLWFSSQEELEEFLRSFGGSTIHDEIIDDVNAMDLLARGLDKRIRLGEQELQRNLSYWKHLAEHFKVLREDMMMWQHPHERSPSRKMFELLDSADPGFSVEKLKQKLKIIKRNDLVEKLKGTATLQDLFENKIYKSICVQLDYNGSWQTLGLELGISREKRESIAIDSSTSYFQTVLEIIRTREPYLTVKEMRDFFEKEKRRDVCNVLPEGGTIQTLLEDIECLESLSVLLDKESPGLKNWRHFARKFGVSLDECNNLKPEALSPTKTLMEHIVQVEPKLTVKTLIEALKKIGRRDVVLALTKFFLDRSRTKQDANEKSVSADEEVPKSP